jgi:hypothetical protein
MPERRFITLYTAASMFCKTVIVILMLLATYVIWPVPLSLAGEGDFHLRINGELVSLDAKATSLRRILSRLEREEGLWFKGDEALLDQEVNVSFENLPLQVGLKRILGSTNYSLIFDEKGGLIGVMVFARSQYVHTPSERKSASARSTLPRGHFVGRGHVTEPPDEPDFSSRPNPDVSASELDKGNLPPGGGPVKRSEESGVDSKDATESENPPPDIDLEAIENIKDPADLEKFLPPGGEPQP